MMTELFNTVEELTETYLVTWVIQRCGGTLGSSKYSMEFNDYLEARNHILGLMGDEDYIPLKKLELKTLKSGVK